MAKEPTKKQLAALKVFISEMEYLFGVQNWQSKLSFTEGDPDYSASNKVDTEYLRYTLEIHPSFWEDAIEFRASAIIHEMCHIPTDGLYSALLDAIEGKLHNKAQIRLYAENATVQFENIIFLLLGKRKKAEHFRKALEKYLLSEKKQPIKTNKKKRK